MEMTTYYGVTRSDIYLEHHGIKGQKWGVRRFRNEDGSLTAAGKKRAAKLEKYRSKETSNLVQDYANTRRKDYRRTGKALDKYDKAREAYEEGRITDTKLQAKLNNVEKAQFREAVNAGMYMAERNRLRNMTLEELSADKKNARAYKMTAVGMSAASILLSPATGVAAIGIPDTRAFKTSQRVSNTDRAAVERYANDTARVTKDIAAAGRGTRNTRSAAEYEANIKLSRRKHRPITKRLRDDLGISDDTIY